VNGMSKVINIVCAWRKMQITQMSDQVIPISRPPHRYYANAVQRKELPASVVLNVTIAKREDNCRVIGHDKVSVASAGEDDGHVSLSCGV
jgi:hypothetical protein